MSTFLPEQPSFGALLGRGLGQGLSTGIGKGMDLIQQMALERAKQKALMDILQPQKRQQSIAPEGIKPDTGMDFSQRLQDVSQAKPPKAEGLDFGEITPEQELAVAQMNPAISRMISESKKREQKSIEAASARHHEIAKDALKQSATIAEQLPQKEMSLQSMADAIESGNLSFFSPDNLAELTGIEGLRTPEGAAFVTAGKEFFLGNLSRVGAKGLNQWMEKQIRGMAPTLGRKTESNLAVTEILKAEIDVQKKQIELTNKIADEMEKKHGYVRRDLAEQVRKELTPYAVGRQKEAKKRIEDIKDQYTHKNKEGILMRDPGGNLRRVKHQDIKKALDAGYRKEQ